MKLLDILYRIPKSVKQKVSFEDAPLFTTTMLSFGKIQSLQGSIEQSDNNIQYMFHLEKITAQEDYKKICETIYTKIHRNVLRKYSTVSDRYISAVEPLPLTAIIE